MKSPLDLIHDLQILVDDRVNLQTDPAVRDIEDALKELARYRDARIDGVDVAALIDEATPDDPFKNDAWVNGYVAEYYGNLRRDLLAALYYAAARAAEDAAKPEALEWESGRCEIHGWWFKVVPNRDEEWELHVANARYSVFFVIHCDLEVDAKAEATRIARALGLLRKEADDA